MIIPHIFRVAGCARVGFRLVGNGQGIVGRQEPLCKEYRHQQRHNGYQIDHKRQMPVSPFDETDYEGGEHECEVGDTRLDAHLMQTEPAYESFGEQACRKGNDKSASHAESAADDNKRNNIVREKVCDA